MATDKEQKELHPAEIAKLEAEAEKFKGEAAKAKAEAANAKAEARDNEAQAELTELELQKAQESRNRRVASWSHQHIYHFNQVVNAKSCQECMNELNFWDQDAPGCDIEIVFDSPGGSVFDGMALYDYIQDLRRKGHKVTTNTRGMAASMGGILLQAGDVRVMGAEAWILIHEISTITGGKIGEIEDEVALVKKIQGRVLDIFAARSKMKKTTIAAKWRRRDWWIDSNEAVKLGLVDEVR